METMTHIASLHSPPDPIEQPDCKRQKMAPMIWQKHEIYDDGATLDKAVFDKLLKEKKLSLVLDLDHTLLHSVRFNSLTQQEREFIIKLGKGECTNSSLLKGSMYGFNFMGEKFLTKLRPGLEYFLEEASKMFRLHVFTKSCRVYAMGMMKLIDPGSVYFGCTSGIFTRESCVLSGGLKSLDLVMGKEGGILILDDKEMAWREEDRENVVVIPSYDFFAGAAGTEEKSLLVNGTDECKTKGPLVECLRFLKLIHAMFFDPLVEEGNLSDRDVKVLKKKLVELENVTADKAGDATVDGCKTVSIL